MTAVAPTDPQPDPPRQPRGAPRPDPRTAWISWLRVVAIAAVVSIHTCGLTAIARGARSDPTGRVAIGLDFGARWAVPVFVMLSGALLLDPARYRGSREFLRKRALRLLPAVVVWNAVYLMVRVASGERLSARGVGEMLVNGRVYTALYFFWIVLGLAVVTPVLVPWVASARRRDLLVAGAALAAVPVLTTLTQPLADQPGTGWENPWTWWFAYLGYYLLGRALTGVVLGRRAVALLGAAGAALVVELCWQWRNADGVGAVVERWLPAESYHSPVVVCLSLVVVLVAQSVVRPGGLAGRLSVGRAAVVGRHLGDATLGVFALHLLVLRGVLRVPHLGGADAAQGVPQLLARWAVVLAVTYVLVLLGRRVAGLRRVL